MKKLLTACLLIMALCHCQNENQGKARKNKNGLNPGDRAGADKDLVDISGSLNLRELLGQRWDNKEDNEIASSQSEGPDWPFGGFYLFNDGVMVKDPRYDMAFGKWTFDDQSKILEFDLRDGTKEKYILHAIRYDELVINKFGESGNLVKYVADGFVQKDLQDDPFYPSNLQWRVKPAVREDDAALRKRLKNCLHFYYMFYMDNNKRNAPTISFYGLPGCFIWYAGGIHLKLKKKLDKNWLNNFFDDKDASRAYLLLDKLISRKYLWDKEETNWVKKNAGVLKQMEEKIDSL